MFEKISQSYQLFKTSIKIIKNDWELLVYSIISWIVSLIILWSFGWIYLFFSKEFTNLSNEQIQTYQIAWLVAYYFIFNYILFFFNTAIIWSVKRILDGKENKFGDWIKDSMNNLSKIAVWSFISAIVSAILRIIESKFDEDSIIWKMIVWIIWATWSITTFFAFPIMILENKGPKDAIKESASLFKNTWWERAILSVWVWLFFFLIYILIIILWAVFIAYTNLAIIWIIAIIITIVITALINSTAETVLRVLIYNYVTTWNIPQNIDNPELIKNIAVQK